MKNQTGLQFNRSEFFVAERSDGVLDRDSIEIKLDQLNDLMDVIAQREKQLIGFRDKLELPPVEVSVDNLIVHEDVQDVERTPSGRKVRKDKGKKRVEKFNGHYKTKRNGEKIWVPPGTRKAKSKATETPKDIKLEMKWEKKDVEAEEFIKSIAGIEEVKDIKTNLDSPPKGKKKKGYYRTSKNGIRHYVGKKPLSLKFKELIGLA